VHAEHLMPDVLAIQPEQDWRDLDALKRQSSRPGQAVVDAQSLGSPNSRGQLGQHPPGHRLQPLARHGALSWASASLRHADDTRHILGAGSSTASWPPPWVGQQAGATAHVQPPTPLGPVELVGRDGHQVTLELPRRGQVAAAGRHRYARARAA